MFDLLYHAFPCQPNLNAGTNINKIINAAEKRLGIDTGKCGEILNQFAN